VEKEISGEGDKWRGDMWRREISGEGDKWRRSIIADMMITKRSLALVTLLMGSGQAKSVVDD